MNGSTTVLVVACVLGGLLTVGGVAGVQGYDLSVAGSVDTPDRTIPVDGHQFTVTEVASVAPNGTLAVDVAAPDDGEYELLLYDSDRRIVTSVDAHANGSHEIQTDGLEPGSYLLVLRDDEVRAVHPVVVDGYAVDVDAPDAAQTGTSTRVVVSVDGVQSSGEPHRVTVVASNGEETVSAVAEREADGRYVAALDLADVPPGEYAVLASVHGEEEVHGRQEPLGLSEERALEVTTEPVDDEWTAGTPTERGAERSTTEGAEGSSASTPADVIEPDSDPDPASHGHGNLVPLGIGGVAVLLGYAYLRRR